jgi:nucleotide-binding universal stress UspA family protein
MPQDVTGSISQPIVAVLVDQFGAEATLKAAYEASLAITDSRVMAFHVFIDPDSTILPTEEIMTEPRRRDLEAVEKEAEQRVQAIYSRISGQLGADRFVWRHVFGREREEVSRLTGSARLLVMHTPCAHASGYVHEAFRAALFDSHCPLLVVPSPYDRRPIERVVIGWNNDGSCIRSVKAAEPWLRHARRVSVVHIGNKSEQHNTIEALLEGMGVIASFRVLEPGGASEGEQILGAASDADWLVIGGYHHQRLIEWIVGGVSRTVFHEAKLPVFAMH